MKPSPDPNKQTREAWDANAEVWDARMGDEGNDFVNLLQWPVMAALLDPKPAERILDVACGNGIFSRRIAGMGADVTAFDFSGELIARAQRYKTDPGSQIRYHILDATNQTDMRSTLSPSAPFDAAISNMALFDISDIQPIFQVLPEVLKPGGAFVFSLVHPAFNNPSSVHIAEEWDDGEIETRYSVKVHRYMTPFHAEGIALRNQPKPQYYFHRPLEYYLKLGFDNGFVLDGFEERAFPPDHPQSHPLSWGGKYSEIPPVVVMRMRLMNV
jgi:2-polyprenyl-3-methyl-5-hydroxy-6-metoxy-1,4-benzoquinol methylase